MAKLALSRNSAHRWVGRASRRCLVAGRPDVRVRRPRRGEADHVVDHARADLVPAHEAREDREPRGVAGCPAERAHRVRVEGPGRARARGPRAPPFWGTRRTAPRGGTRHGRRRARAGRPTRPRRPRSGRSRGPVRPGSLSSSYENDTGTRGCVPGRSCTGCRSGRRSTSRSRSRPSALPTHRCWRPTRRTADGRGGPTRLRARRSRAASWGTPARRGQACHRQGLPRPSATSTRIEMDAVRRVPVTVAPSR